MIDETDRKYLERCLELAEQAVESGNAAFGAVLVAANGTVLFEDYNRTGTGDPTLHPEFAIARWAAANVDEDERGSATVYTSGEHCPMCAAAHGFVGLGRIVYASSAQQTAEWLKELGEEQSVRPLPILDVISGIAVAGPVDDLAERVRRLHGQRRERASS